MSGYGRLFIGRWECAERSGFAQMVRDLSGGVKNCAVAPHWRMTMDENALTRALREYDEYSVPAEPWPRTWDLINRAAETIERLQREIAEEVRAAAECEADNLHAAANRLDAYVGCDDLRLQLRTLRVQLASSKWKESQALKAAAKMESQRNDARRERDEALDRLALVRKSLSNKLRSGNEIPVRRVALGPEDCDQLRGALGEG